MEQCYCLYLFKFRFCVNYLTIILIIHVATHTDVGSYILSYILLVTDDNKQFLDFFCHLPWVANWALKLLSIARHEKACFH